jgi:hypothetical protein
LPIEQGKVANVNVVGAILNRVEIQITPSSTRRTTVPAMAITSAANRPPATGKNVSSSVAIPGILSAAKSVESVKQSGSTSTDAITVWCDSAWRFHAAP